MNTGMLWFDNNSRLALAARIEEAVKYYQKKYGQQPNLCFIHPTMVKSEPAQPPTDQAGIEIRTTDYILPNHFWLGVETEEAH